MNEHICSLYEKKFHWNLIVQPSFLPKSYVINLLVDATHMQLQDTKSVQCYIYIAPDSQ